MTTTPNDSSAPRVTGATIMARALADGTAPIPEQLTEDIIDALIDQFPLSDDDANAIFESSMGRGRAGARIRNYLRPAYPHLFSPEVEPTETRY